MCIYTISTRYLNNFIRQILFLWNREKRCTGVFVFLTLPPYSLHSLFIRIALYAHIIFLFQTTCIQSLVSLSLIIVLATVFYTCNIVPSRIFVQTAAETQPYPRQYTDQMDHMCCVLSHAKSQLFKLLFLPLYLQCPILF